MKAHLQIFGYKFNSDVCKNLLLGTEVFFQLIKLLIYINNDRLNKSEFSERSINQLYNFTMPYYLPLFTKINR